MMTMTHPLLAAGHSLHAPTDCHNPSAACHNTPTPRRVGPGRKKRSSIVPAPMWGWVPEKTASNAAVVEEEEEEMTGPPRAMEEEEEEDEELEEEEEEGDEYDYDQGNDSGAGEEEEPHVPRGFAPQRRNGP